jgi:CheY-like chemotaxis protein
MSAGGPVTLIVDDDAALGRVLVDLLAHEGIGAVHVASGRQALASLERGMDADNGRRTSLATSWDAS